MKLLRTTILTVLLLVFLSVPVLAQTRIATVDLRKLFDGFWKTKQAQTLLNEDQTRLAGEAKSQREDLKKAGDEYQKLLEQANDQALSTEQRDKYKQAAADKLKQLQEAKTALDQYERQAQITISGESQRMHDNILSDIKAAVAAQAKAAGYSLVMDAAGETANAATAVVYSNGENDLTDTVLKRLNAGRTDSAAAAPVVASPSSLLGGTNTPGVNSR
jgi:Skp family chaperone for outer membrane proteins